jgi:ketosteroid isomerase-like protein
MKRMRRNGLASTIPAPPEGEWVTDEARGGAPSEAPIGLAKDAQAPICLTKGEIVARLFEAFNHRDLPAILALVHPDVVFQPMTATVTQAGKPYHGYEGIRRYARDIETHWEELAVHPKQIRAAGQAVVALGLVSGRGAGGSFRDAPTTWVVKFRDGLVASTQIFSDERNVVHALLGEDA